MNNIDKSMCEDFTFMANVVVGIGEVDELTGIPGPQLGIGSIKHLFGK